MVLFSSVASQCPFTPSCLKSCSHQPCTPALCTRPSSLLPAVSSLGQGDLWGVIGLWGGLPQALPLAPLTSLGGRGFWEMGRAML